MIHTYANTLSHTLTRSPKYLIAPLCLTFFLLSLFYVIQDCLSYPAILNYLFYSWEVTHAKTNTHLRKQYLNHNCKIVYMWMYYHHKMLWLKYCQQKYVVVKTVTFNRCHKYIVHTFHVYMFILFRLFATIKKTIWLRQSRNLIL